MNALEPLLLRLNFQLRFIGPDEAEPETYIPFEDLSGRVVHDTMMRSLPEFHSIRFTRSHASYIVMGTKFGLAEIEFSRRRATVAAPHQLIVITVVFGFMLVVIAMAYMHNQLRPIKRLADVSARWLR